MRALIRWAAGRIPASSSEIVNGELAVFDVVPSNLLSFHGMSIPMKKIVPEYSLVMPWSDIQCELTDVENEDTPKDLLDSLGYCLLRIRRFSGGDANPNSTVSIRHLPHLRHWGTYISVPAYNVPATTNVFATPLIESANAPGECQYLNPVARGPMPPALMIIARMKKTINANTLILQSISQLDASTHTAHGNLQR